MNASIYFNNSNDNVNLNEADDISNSSIIDHSSWRMITRIFTILSIIVFLVIFLWWYFERKYITNLYSDISIEMNFNVALQSTLMELTEKTKYVCDHVIDAGETRYILPKRRDTNEIGQAFEDYPLDKDIMKLILIDY